MGGWEEGEEGEGMDSGRKDWDEIYGIGNQRLTHSLHINSTFYRTSRRIT